MQAIAEAITTCMNLLVTACVLNQSRGHWLLLDVSVAIINLIMAIESNYILLLMGVKLVISLMLSSKC